MGEGKMKHYQSGKYNRLRRMKGTPDRTYAPGGYTPPSNNRWLLHETGVKKVITKKAPAKQASAKKLLVQESRCCKRSSRLLPVLLGKRHSTPSRNKAETQTVWMKFWENSVPIYSPMYGNRWNVPLSISMKHNRRFRQRWPPLHRSSAATQQQRLLKLVLNLLHISMRKGRSMKSPRKNQELGGNLI